VLYTSDHGLLWADHGWLRKSVPYRPSLEVPFYLSWPGGGLGTARTDDRLTAHVDIAPTLLDAAGITPGHPARRPLAARHPGPRPCCSPSGGGTARRSSRSAVGRRTSARPSSTRSATASAWTGRAGCPAG
jgi:hypothetical protein